MQGISRTTPRIRYAARLRHGFLAVGTIGAVAGLSLMMAVQVAAAAAITVTVNSDGSRTHLEGTFYSIHIADFTDVNACTAPGVCNSGTDYSANIQWGDNSTHSIVAAQFVSQSGNTGTYSVTAPHTYPDEFNCPGGTCGYPIHVQVTNNISSTTSGNFGFFAIKDQPLAANPSSFSANAQAPFSGVIGSFQDGNKLAADHDQGNGPEFSESVNWGDGSTTTGSVTIGTCSPTTSGLGVGQGCQVAVNGGPHTYALVGRYTVTVIVADGLNQFTTVVLSTANVFESRFATNQAPGGTPGTRATNQSPASGPGLRIAHVRSS